MPTASGVLVNMSCVTIILTSNCNLESQCTHVTHIKVMDVQNLKKN